MVVIGGLILSTVLSLLIVPSFYVITDTIQTRYYALGRKLLGRFSRSGDGGDE